MSKELPLAQSVAFITLGCAKNEADSRAMQEQLARYGFTLSATPETADFLLLNTCAFIEAAVEESLDTIMELIASPRIQTGEAKLLVAGCLPSRYGDALLSELPEVTAFVPVAEEEGLVQTLLRVSGRAHDMPSNELGQDTFSSAAGKDTSSSAAGKDTSSSAAGQDTFSSIGEDTFSGTDQDIKHRTEALVSEKPWAYVKVSDGCSRHCSYCTIPLIRGPYQSYAFASIKAEVDKLVAQGVREIVLIGQDTGIWSEPPYKKGAQHEEGPSNLAQLLDVLAVYYPNTWFRVLYLQPQGVTDELLEVISSHENIANYLDIPLQHASAKVLSVMNRKGSGKEYLELLTRIRERVQNVTLRTTIMVGFPGETDDDYEELCTFLEAASFDYVGVFSYSREDGTVAAELAQQLDKEIVAERAQRIRDLADHISFERIEEQVGSLHEVLVCGQDEEGVYGRTQSQAPEVDGITYLWATPENVGDGVELSREGHSLDAGTTSEQQCETAVRTKISEASRDAATPSYDFTRGAIVRTRISEAVLYDFFAEVL